MPEKNATCCFTGHRPAKLPWRGNENDPRCVKLKSDLAASLEEIYDIGCRHFICGMAIGCDMFFAEAVMELKEKHGDVTFEAAIPCGSQPDRWSKANRLRYNKIIDSADKVWVLQYGYTRDCMMQRNRYMVDNSAVLLACFNGRSGGTMKTILYAQRSGLKTVIIDVE